MTPVGPRRMGIREKDGICYPGTAPIIVIVARRCAEVQQQDLRRRLGHHRNPAASAGMRDDRSTCHCTIGSTAADRELDAASTLRLMDRNNWLKRHENEGWQCPGQGHCRL